MVEVWHRDHMAGNILLGVGRISLEGILASEKTKLNVSRTNHGTPLICLDENVEVLVFIV